MIVLPETTDTLQVVLADAIATNQLPILTAWRDITTSAYTPGRTALNTNSTTAVNAVGSPASSTQRVVDMLNVFNADTASATVTVRFNANGTTYVLWMGTLQPGDTLHYADGVGFRVERTLQAIKSFTVHGDAGVNFAMTNATQAERFAGNATRHLFMVDLEGYTQVRFRVNKQVGSASANTPRFRAKYYTSYNTTVGNFLTLGDGAEVEVNMTATGYADTGWMDLAAGARINGCCIGFTELGGDGVADPAVGATDILFR